jgi:immune inhibitor A
MKISLKKSIFAFAAMFLSSALLAAPADPMPRTISQPDGTELHICLHGDEFGSYITTDDGLLIVQNENGEYEYAYFAEQEQAIRTLGVKARNAKFRSSDEKQFEKKCRVQDGEKLLEKLRNRQSIRPKQVNKRCFPAKNLVIMVNYSDVAFSAENTQAAIDSMFNGEEYHYAGSEGSVRKYFIDQSNGQYKPEFDVVGPYTLPNNQAYYGSNSLTISDTRIGDLIIDACRLAEEGGADFSKYDSNNDGQVDCVYVLYAGLGEANGGTSTTVWPKNWDLVTAIYYYGCAENYTQYINGNTVNCPYYDGKIINEFVASPELRKGNLRVGVGTSCHEFSHALGLPDIYSTGTSSYSDQTPKYWDVMDVGMYNNSGITPPNYSAYERYWLGWVEPRLLNSAEDVVLQPDFSDCAKITKDGKTRTAYSSDTIYYLENRQKTGWDAYLPGHGLVVMRLRYNTTSWTNNQVNVSSIRYTIVRADGSKTGYSAANSFPGTKNVTTFVPFADFPLNDIAESDGNITFKFMYCDTAQKFGVEFYSDNCVEPTVPDSIARGETLVLPVVPNEGYEIKSANEFVISMKTCGVERTLVANVGYTYEGNTLIIPNVEGDLVIMIMASQKTATLYNAAEKSSLAAVRCEAGVQIIGLPTDAEVRIYDTVGRLILTDMPAASEKIYNLPSGIYMVRVANQILKVII